MDPGGAILDRLAIHLHRSLIDLSRRVATGLRELALNQKLADPERWILALHRQAPLEGLARSTTFGELLLEARARPLRGVGAVVERDDALRQVLLRHHRMQLVRAKLSRHAL